MKRIHFLKQVRLTWLALFLCLSSIGQEINVIPYPNDIIRQAGVFNLSGARNIYFDGACRNEAIYLQKLLSREHNLKIPATEKKNMRLSSGAIYLTTDNPDTDTMTNEEYRLKVEQDKVIIMGDPAGIFYGIQSFRQLIKDEPATKLTVACMTINDRPRFKWRAFMLDEGRYFKGAEVVKNLLDEMAMLKMNTFHWHLTDDGGWRIEIKKYPKLTEIGSKRRMSELGTWLSNVFDSVPHSGFYTQDQIKDIIKYAADRHITIIPEIEMPGHASAAIASYPWLGAENKQIEVPISFGIKLDVFNVANARVTRFIRDVLDEVMALFPSRVVHIGGDEVKYDQWKQSAEVNDYMKKNNIRSYADLQISFTNSISNYLEQKGHRMMGWNEIMGGHHSNNDSLDASAQQKLSSNVIIHFWTGDPLIVTKAAEKGYDVVNSFWEYTYLDYDYKTTDLTKAYSFDPIPGTLPSNLHHKVLGLGCQMWGEWIPTVKRMNYLIYPRIAAFAETGWTEKGRKNLTRFRNSLPAYFKKQWSKKGIIIQAEQE